MTYPAKFIAAIDSCYSKKKQLKTENWLQPIAETQFSHCLS